MESVVGLISFVIGFSIALMIFRSKNVGILHICEQANDKPELLLELFHDVEVLKKRKSVSFKVISR